MACDVDRSVVGTIVLACLAVGAVAQAPEASPSRPTFARVLDDTGGPIAGAEVTFVGGMPHVSPTLQDVHVEHVATDARGRAVARLRPGLCYVAWAAGPVTDGVGATSAVEGYFAAGAMIELVCDQPEPARTATVHGLDRWQHLGPFRLFAWTSLPGMARELKLTDDRTIAIPRGPFEVFEVRLANGEALWHGWLDEELRIPPPQRIRVAAVDDNGAPLVAATVEHRVGRLSSWRLDGLRSVGLDRMRRLGRTDARGRCEVEVPYDGDPLRSGRDDLLLFVTGDGRPAVAGGIWARSRYVSDRKVPRFEGDELRFECRRPAPLRGRLAGAPRGTVAHLAAVCKLFLQRTSYMHDARVFTAPVRADGTFVFDDVPAELHSCRLTFLPASDTEWRSPVYPPEQRRQLPAELEPVADQAPVSTYARVALEVTDANGGPARGAIALLSSGDREGVLMRDSLVRVPLDERGAAELRLVPGLWVVVVVTGSGFGGERFEVAASTRSMRIQLDPLDTAHAVLHDEHGEPVEGAGVQLRGTSTRGTIDPVNSILQGLRRLIRTQWQRLRTDADGRVAIPYVPVEGVRQRVELRWDGGRSQEFELRAGQPIEVRERESDAGR